MSDRAQRFLLWMLTIVLIGGTVYGLRYATGYRVAAGLTPAAPSLLPPDVNLRLSRVRAIGRDRGQVAWTVQADRIDTTRSRDRLQFVGNVRATLLQKGKPHTVFSAPYAEYQTVAKRLTALGTVPPAASSPLAPSGAVAPALAGLVVCTVQGSQSNGRDTLRVETGEASWDVGGKKIVCPGHVKATRGTSVVQGDAFEADVQTRDFHVSRFSAQFEVGEDVNPGEAFGSVKEMVR